MGAHYAMMRGDDRSRIEALEAQCAKWAHDYATAVLARDSEILQLRAEIQRLKTEIADLRAEIRTS